jgi:hypothetical protein
LPWIPCTAGRCRRSCPTRWRWTRSCPQSCSGESRGTLRLHNKTMHKIINDQNML